MITFQTVLIAYFLMITAYTFVEVYLQKRYNNGERAKTEKSFLLLILPFYMVIYFAPLENYLLNLTLHISSISIGMALFIAAVIIRVSAMNTLNKNFSIAIEAKNDGKLIETGIYKQIRHPLYLAVMLMVIGSALIFSCMVAWFFVALTFAGVIIRIRKEESFLMEQFPEYSAYMVRSKKMLPFIY